MTFVVHYCDHALSVVRPSSLTFHIFDFSSDTTEQNSTKLDRSKNSTSSTEFVFFGPIGKTSWPPWPLIGWDIFDFSSETAERNSTKLDGKQDLNVLYQVCVFWADRKNKMAALTSDWLRHFRLLLWNRWTELNETWQETRSQRHLPSLCFLGRSEKTRWPRWPLIGWDIFDFSSETAEQNSALLDGKQDLNVLYQVCVFWADRNNNMVALTSDWLRHFRLLLWNGWTEFNETWQETRSQRPLPSLCFSRWSEKQHGSPGLWLAETFPTSPLKQLNGIQRNLTGSKISMSPTKFVFFGPIGKTRWPPWPLIGWDIFDFSSETAKRNSTKLIRKQYLNVIYQVFVFQADQKNKMAALASDWLRHFRLLLWKGWTEFNKTWQEARSQRPLPRLCFSGRSEKQDGSGLWFDETFFYFSSETAERNSTKLVFFALIGKTIWRPLPLIGWEFSTSPLKPLNGIQWNLTGSKISTSSTKFVFFGPISKQKCPPWPIPQKGGTLYSGAWYVALWASGFGKIFWPKGGATLATLPLDPPMPCINYITLGAERYIYM